MVERWKDEPINATFARVYQTNKSNAKSESRAERLSTAPIQPGRVFKDPRDIARKVRSFRKDFKANETVARKLLYARRLTRWVVDVVGTTVHVAPVRYAIYEDVSIEQMQHAIPSATDTPGMIEEYRLTEIFAGKIYEQAIKAIRKLSGRDDDVTVFLPAQRYLVSEDPVRCDDFKKWTKHALKPKQNRLESFDEAIRREETNRHRRGAHRTLVQLFEQCDVKELLFRNAHFAMLLKDDANVIAFIAREISNHDLHEALRDVLAEALVYKFRYKERLANMTFVVAFSEPIADSNWDAVRLLNSFEILVAAQNEITERLELISKKPKALLSSLSWLRPE